MIDITKINVFNLQGALRGMRNPLESWSKSDSQFFCYYSLTDRRCEYHEGCAVSLGKEDLALAQKLILAGSDHSKFMRQIFVSMDINAPLYWWKEMSTYKVGTVANSCSTMHKLAATPITKEMFSFDEELDALDIQNYKEEYDGWRPYLSLGKCIEEHINNCEVLRLKYLETKDVRYWRALVQLLPSSWNQKRTWTANYAVLRNIYFARRNHKITEWVEFCKRIEKLPYAKELICCEKETK